MQSLLRFTKRHQERASVNTSTENLIEQLRKERETLLGRLAAIDAMLTAYGGNATRPPNTRTAPIEELPTGYPQLDNMRTRDAINLYLSWAKDKEREVTLGELERVLLAHRVVSFRGKVFGESRFPFKTLTNIIGSPDNANFWNVDMHSPEHFQRTDVIGLRPKERAEHAEVSLREPSA